MTLRIKEIRETRGWSQQTLAEAAGLSRPQLSQIETGTRPANTLRLTSIAKALRVGIDELFDHVERPEAQIVADLMRNMSDEDRSALIRYAKAMANQR